VLCHPGPKETGEPHPGLRALRTAGSPTDLAGNDQWAHTALRQIVVGGNARDRDKDKEFGQKAFHAFTSGVLRREGTHVGLAQVPEVLLEGMRLGHASEALGAR
jgi:hypothetical protein